MNLSQIKRQRMLDFLETLKKEHTDDESIRAFTEIENQLRDKKYGLVWEEHSERVDEMLEENIPIFTEDASKKITAFADGGYNFILEGDNLQSLYLLQKTHKGLIDVIYIDPPYNTGKKNDEQSSGFIYDDKIVDETDSYIHSKWLSFMKVRLELARTLLKPDGIIFISIGKEEIATLRLLCDEIFGGKNLLGQIVRRTKTTSFRGNYFALRLDYILCYSSGVVPPARFMDVVDTSKYTKTETEGVFAGEKYKDDTAFYLSTLETRPNQRYFIECPDGELVVPPGSTIPTIEIDGEKCVPNNGDGVWRWERDQYLSKKHYLSFKRTTRSPLLTSKGEKASWNVYTKSYYCEKKDDGNIPTELLLDFINRNGSEEAKSLGIDFSFPKPSELIKYLIYITNKKKDITILDFFAGSGTTAQSVLSLNKEDGGTRCFILCTNNENNICERVTYQRCKTVITGIKGDGKKYSDGLPANLKYFKCDWTPRKPEDYLLSNALCLHIREMIELQHGIEIDNVRNVLILNKADFRKYVMDDTVYSQIENIWVNQNIIFNSDEMERLNALGFKYIPREFFGQELREAAE